MVLKENAVENLKNFLEMEKVKRVYDALKVGYDNDNLVIMDTFLQNILNQLFLEFPKVVELEESDYAGSQEKKAESVKKFMQGDDKRFGVGLDLLCNYILKNKKLWFNFQGLAVNENANAIKFFEDKELEYSSKDEIMMVYNSIIDNLNKVFATDIFNSIKL